MTPVAAANQRMWLEELAWAARGDSAKARRDGTPQPRAQGRERHRLVDGMLLAGLVVTEIPWLVFLGYLLQKGLRAALA